MTAFERLFEPFQAGRLRLPNRIVVTPHGTSMVRDGLITDDDIAYYEARARSGPAMIIGGAIVAHRTSTLRSRSLVEGYDERVVDGLKRRCAAMHAHGVKSVGQLVHLGRERIGAESDYAPSAPSPIRSPRDLFPPHMLEAAEIGELIEGFSDSAMNLQRSDHDGVEIHAAHGYLAAQFLSPGTNLRGDAYGGTPEKRLRFLREVLEAIRARCRADFIVGVRLSADEESADGLGIPDTVRIANELARLQLADYLSITLGMRGGYVKDLSQPDATAARAAGIIRKSCGLPIIVGQRITTPEMAEQVLANGDGDLIGMTRAFIADAEWLAKVRRGEAARIRPCIGVNQDCRAFAPHLHCAVNATTGRECQAPFNNAAPAARRRRIAVVGAGPGGLEAARVAALRGHSVTLFEASDAVGGQFLYASSVPHRQGLRRFIDWLLAEVRHLGVQLELGARVDGPEPLQGRFDAAVIATGAVANPLEADLAAPNVISWFDVLARGVPQPSANGRAVVVDDGSAFWWTYGVAEAVAQAGWRLLIATPATAVASAIPAESVGPLLARLGRAGTEYRVLSVLTGVSGEAAQLANAASGEEEAIECGLVVVQTGRSAVTGLAGRMKDAALEWHMVGDCVSPRRMSHAVFEGHRVAQML